MNFLKSLVQPVIKDNPFNKGVVVLLVLSVLAALLATSSLDNMTGFAVAPEEHIEHDYPEYPDQDSLEAPEFEEPRFEEPGNPYLLVPDTGIMTYNPLTGLPMDEARAQNRPLAIVLANCVDSIPMNGVSQADVIYELLVEGGITRMLALYQDFSDVQMVGSIRSARHYTVEFARSHDAILIHAGGSQPYAYRTISELGVPNLDEVGGNRREIFFRDRGRIGGRRIDTLHAVVTTNARVAQFLPQYDFDLDHTLGFEQGWIFADDATPTGGSAATNAVVTFPGGKTSIFTFDTNENVYRMSQFRRDFVDANDGSRPGFTNVIVMRTSITSLPGDRAGRQDVVTVGEGEGYFIHGGRSVPINWSRADRESPLVFTNLDGSPLELGRGSTYIGVTSTRADVTIR
ncbi:MAG: DUF3048 domain-containing protein [Oscillospiraceae bacterium]|nr:DUF3048 domain-containing protein [Oscillospiraceae bacterium]